MRSQPTNVTDGWTTDGETTFSQQFRVTNVCATRGKTSSGSCRATQLHNRISVQSTCRTRSLSLVTLPRPPVSSSLQINNRSFTYASPYLWNQLPSSFRQPHSVHSPPGSPHPVHITSSQSPPSLSSPITASTFHS